jgi:hypothetical protein
MFAAALVIVLGLLAGCPGGSSIGDACSLDSPCSDGEICDFTNDGGPICISSDGDLDGDGLANGADFCQHAPGGAFDEDKDGIGDECDRCPIARPRSTPDSDGDMVDAPCDPAPTEAGDEILFFDGFANGLAAEWKPTTASAWSAANGEVTVTLPTVGTQDFLQRTVIGKSNVAIEAGYRVDKVENSNIRHVVGVYANDPRPAGTAEMQCGVSRADTAAADLVVVETNNGAMSMPTIDPALLTTKLYRVGAYVQGTRAGCSVIADNTPLGTVQQTITADDLSSIALTAQAVTVRFQYVIVVGK